MNLDISVPEQRAAKHFPRGGATLDDVANETTIILENTISTLRLACQCIEFSSEKLPQKQIEGLLNQAISLLLVATGHFETLTIYTGYGQDEKQKIEDVIDTIKCVLTNGLGCITPIYLSPTVYGLLITLSLIEDSLDDQHSNEFESPIQPPVNPKKPVSPVSQQVH